MFANSTREKTCVLHPLAGICEYFTLGRGGGGVGNPMQMRLRRFNSADTTNSNSVPFEF